MCLKCKPVPWSAADYEMAKKLKIKKSKKFWYNENNVISLLKQNTNTMMDYKIVSSTYPEGLTSKVKEMMEEGWKPIGGHSVVETHKQNRYSGSQHMDTIIKIEYSQTLIKE